MNIKLPTQYYIPDFPKKIAEVISKYTHKSAIVRIYLRKENITVYDRQAESSRSYPAYYLMSTISCPEDEEAASSLAFDLSLLYKNESQIDQFWFSSLPVAIFSCNMGQAFNITEKAIEEWSLDNPGVNFEFYDFSEN